MSHVDPARPSWKGRPQVRTSISGLDQILDGGLPASRLYLVDGDPGTGKTTLAMQFLMEGVRQGERALYITLSESREELEEVAASHGWTLEGIDIFELSVEGGESEEAYTLFHPAEVELEQTVNAVFKSVEETSPARVVFDSLSEMRLLARDPLRFRRQILAMKQFFAGRQCTVLLLDDRTGPESNLQLHSLAHGVIILEHLALEYGAERRRLQVSKLRGQRFRGGYHDFRIRTGGLSVYPRIERPSETRSSTGLVASGSAALDVLLGGGIARGTSVLITGAAGTGKSVLATQYATAAVARGEKVRFYLFDERINTFLMRGAGLGMGFEPAIEAGNLKLKQVEPTELTPGEFACDVMSCVENEGVTMIVVDSINGYMQSMAEERLLPIQVHELLSYLSDRGVTAFMTLVQRGIFGHPVDEAADVSYLADAVILLRYFEVHGAVRQAISVVKKRSGNHEHTIREVSIGAGGMLVGEPLRDFQGVLTGVPEYLGGTGALMQEKKVREPKPHA